MQNVQYTRNQLQENIFKPLGLEILSEYNSSSQNYTAKKIILLLLPRIVFLLYFLSTI